MVMNGKHTTDDSLCGEIRELLENGIPEDRRAEVEAHLAVCPDCRAEARIREAAAALYAEVPPGFTDGVMRLVQAERVRGKRRLLWLRRISAAAAVLVLVPVLAVGVPYLMQAEKHVSPDAASLAETAETPLSLKYAFADNSGYGSEDTAMTEADAADGKTAETAETAEETAAETAEEAADMILLPPENVTAARLPAAELPPDSTDDPALGGEDAGGGDAVAENDLLLAETTARTEPETTAAPGSAPDYVAAKSPETSAKRSETGTLSVSSCEPAEEPEESPALTVICALAPREAFDEWAAAYEGAEEDAPADACRALGITREAFEAQAEQMHFSFTGEELDAIFPDGTDTAEAS